MGSLQVPPVLVRFGVFEADLRAGELRRNGVRVRLQDLPFRVLTLLVSRPGEVITREEFRQALWPPDVFVDFEQSISSAVMRLRDALNDSADNPIFIQTIERRGYRWIGPIQSHTMDPVVPDQAPPAAQMKESLNSVARDAMGSTPPAQQSNTKTRRRLIAAAILALLVVAGFLLWRWQRPAPISSIAVLPFDNLSAPSFNDAFSDGLTDEIAASVSHLDGVRVAGRRSAYVFKGKHDDLREIGSRLNVEAVVEGSVQRAADRTHVTVELNRTRDGFTIWSQTYDGTTSDWMQIESQIAGSIARALARKISPTTPASHDPEAHALYLEARYQWNQRNYPAELKSVDLLQQAIARDPNYALAWAGLADSLIAIGDVEEVDPAAYLPRARDAALKALQLDSSLAEPHAALGMVAAHYDYDWPTAEREYKKAFELNPNYASAHQYYALGLMAHGRFAEAEAQLDTARRLDPLALIVDVDLALLRKFQRNFDAVIDVSKSILQRDPNYHLGYSMLTTGYLCERRWDDWRAADAKVPQGEFLRAIANGHRDEIDRAFRKLTDEAKAGGRRPYDVGHYGLMKGDRSMALDWLEKSYQHHDYWMLFINVDPEYDPIRSEPRFQAILHRLGVG
ncbi:MAG: winged helix-turn-helix domain-containing protein [Acidobacteria bacterium]|nr:winged helix-turn-helix domain-containing protein [Acidobacteriota bacterium]